MLETEEKEAIDKGLRVPWLIWAGIFTSLLIYVLVCHILSEGVQIVRYEEWSDSSVRLLRNILYAISAVTVILTFYLRRIYLKVRPPTHESHRVQCRPSYLNQPPYVDQYNVTIIISLALSESIGIYGLLLFLLRGDFTTLYTFIAVSALAMVFYRPKRDELEKLALAYKKQDQSAPEM